MPQVLYMQHNSGSKVLVWEISETEDYFKDRLTDFVEEDAEYINCSIPHKRVQLLACRYACKQLLEQIQIPFKGIIKDEYGKPHLHNLPYHISLTHTSTFVAVAFHKNKPLGIDMEKPTDKLWKIRDRLFTKEEIFLIGSSIKTMTLFWSAKEGLYKLYGKRGLDFKEHIQIKRTRDYYTGVIQKDSYHSYHEIFYTEVFSYGLTLVI